MYRINVDNIKVFANFLNAVEVDFVDFFFSEGSALIVLNDSEVFAACNINCEIGLSGRAISIRMKRSLLRDLVIEGSINFSMENGVVCADFRNTEEDLVWSVTFPQQAAASVLYKNKVDLLQKRSTILDLSFEDFGVLPRICSSARKTLSVNNGVCSIIVSPGIAVYKKIAAKGSFSVSSKNLAILRKCGSEMFAIENYVGAVNRNFAVLVVRNRQDVDDLYEYVAGDKSALYKSQYEAEINLSKILRFYRARKVKELPAMIDLESRICNLTISGIAYRIHADISNERKAPKFSMGTISIPYSVINGILQYMPSPKFLLCKKKTFYQLWQDDYVILFN